MQGYYGKPAETAQALDREGWLHSGDMGIMRSDGHLRFVGRYKDMLKIGGENVDPMEVEAFLMSLAGINLAAVVSFPDARLSEVGVAFVDELEFLRSFSLVKNEIRRCLQVAQLAKRPSTRRA